MRPEAVSTPTSGHGSVIASLASPHSSSPDPDLPAVESVDANQLELFYHFSRSNFDLPMAAEGGGPMDSSVIVEAALASPFLINEMLGFSALHLAHIRPARSQFYRHQAVGLQTHALSIFNREPPTVTQENCIAILLFSFFMAMHMLHDTVASENKDDFLDRFIGYMQLHRGLRIVTEGTWHLMLESKLGQAIRTTQGASERKASGSHTAELRDFISASEELKDNEKIACQDALDRIQWVLNDVEEKGQHSTSFSTYLQMNTWPVTTQPEFIVLLSAKTPIALLVLAYYAIPLHLCRHIWVIGDAGSLLATSIRQCVSEEWHMWLVRLEEIINAIT
ncbi:hypothetical protein MGN70_007694 [Eutypa lata]|nr:hypothetical protein MGN70_007694 [Eutypa lata]